MDDINPVIFAIPFYFILIGLELIVDVWNKSKLYRLNDALSNIGCGIGDQVIGAFVKILTIGVYDIVFLRYAWFDLPQNTWTFIAAFIGVDFCYYWVHRSAHEVNFLWASHAVHHQSEDYNLSVALRQSWFHKFFTFPYYLPLALLGIPTFYFVLAFGFNLLYQFWIHTETIGRMGVFEWILNTPSHHRVHHGRNPQYIDRNHAGVFIIWDRLFGTFEPEVDPPVYGVTSPLASWNPLWANLRNWKSMWDESRQMPNWRDRFLIWVKPPGWRPKSLGGTLAIPPVKREKYLKFRTVAPIVLNYYLLFQYLLVVLGSVFFLLGFETFQVWEQWSFALLIILAITNIGSLFERRKWAFVLEHFRLLLSMLMAISFFDQTSYETMGLFVVSVLTFLSLIWLMALGKFMKRFV